MDIFEVPLASLVSQMVRSPPECRKLRFNPWVRKIPLEKGMATHSDILAWRIPWTEELGVHGVAKSW